MANPISDKIKTGTIGELLVQLRLLQYDVQAAPPLKDSGNDLIAVKGNIFRTIQVRTTTKESFTKPSNKIIYHILAIVYLKGHDNEIRLDETNIYIIPKNKVLNIGSNMSCIKKYLISEELVEKLFANGKKSSNIKD